MLNKKRLITIGLLSVYTTLNLGIFGENVLAQNIPVTLPPTESIQPLPENLPPENKIENQFQVYRLGVGDVIAINVQRFPDLSLQAQVNLEGNIILPLVGKLSVMGLTLEEVQQKIGVLYNRYVINPVVTVNLFSQRQAQITIVGEVSKPGFYPVQGMPQLTTVLLLAGGTTNLADLRSIIVRRTLINGQILEQNVDLFTPLQNGESLPNLKLQDGDSVIVSKLEVGNTKDYDRLLVSRSSLASQQISVRVLSYAGGGIGKLNLPNGSSFLDALTAIAPNPDNANLRDVALIRFDPTQGRAITQKLDGKRALNGDLAQNVPLQNNDVIVIGRTFVAKITYALNAFTQPFRDVLGFLLFFDSLSDSASNLFSPNRR